MIYLKRWILDDFRRRGQFSVRDEIKRDGDLINSNSISNMKLKSINYMPMMADKKRRYLNLNLRDLLIIFHGWIKMGRWSIWYCHWRGPGPIQFNSIQSSSIGESIWWISMDERGDYGDFRWSYLHNLPSVLLNSALWSCGYWSANWRRASWAQTMKAFIGRLTWVSLFSGLDLRKKSKMKSTRHDCSGGHRSPPVGQGHQTPVVTLQNFGHSVANVRFWQVSQLGRWNVQSWR